MNRSTTIASYESRCALCDEIIYEGEEVALLQYDDEWVHLKCEEEEYW